MALLDRLRRLLLLLLLRLRLKRCARVPDGEDLHLRSTRQ